MVTLGEGGEKGDASLGLSERNGNRQGLKGESDKLSIKHFPGIYIRETKRTPSYIRDIAFGRL